MAVASFCGIIPDHLEFIDYYFMDGSQKSDTGWLVGYVTLGKFITCLFSNDAWTIVSIYIHVARDPVVLEVFILLGKTSMKVEDCMGFVIVKKTQNFLDGTREID